MDVIFFRHGQADWPEWKGADARRPLTQQGIQETLRMAQLLARLGAGPELVLTSPLPRALETARIVAKELGVKLREEPALSPGCSPDLFRKIVKQNEAISSLLVVGHQPDFSAIMRSLTGGRVKLSKSGVARVELDEELDGKLSWLLPAKLVRTLES